MFDFSIIKIESQGRELKPNSPKGGINDDKLPMEDGKDDDLEIVELPNDTNGKNRKHILETLKIIFQLFIRLFVFFTFK